MVVVTPDTINVHRNTGSLRETLQTMRQHLAAQITNLLPLETQVDDAEGSVREVDHGATERFVERRVGAAEARKAGCGVESGFKSLDPSVTA